MEKTEPWSLPEVLEAVQEAKYHGIEVGDGPLTKEHDDVITTDC